MGRYDEALELFGSGFNCAQSVLGSYVERQTDEGELALKLAAGFGGGMRMGEVCGAVTGALMVIGLREGQYKAEDKAAKEKCSRLTRDFMEEYAKRKGTLLCREILGYDVRDASAAQAHAASKGQKCGEAIRLAIELLGEMGIE